MGEGRAIAINAAQLEIDIKVDGAASATQQIKGVGSAVDETGGKMTAAGQKTSAFGKAFQSIGPMATVGVAAAGTAVVKFGADSFNAFVGFQKQMNEVFSLMPGISQQAMGDMTAQVKDFSREFGVLPEKVVPALYEALSSGIPADNVFEFLGTAQKAAIGGVTDTKTAVDGLTSVINAYGADTLSAGQASDIMFTAVKVGKTTFEELSASLFNVNPVASALGVQFSDVAAALAAMTAQGIPTSVATTQLRQMFVELSDSGSGLAKTFTQISGQSFKDFIAGGGTVQGALQLLEQHAQATGVGINDLFGSVEAGSAALSLTGKGTEAFSSALDQMAQSSGATDQAFDTMQSGISADIDRMKANFATFQLDVGEKLAGAAVAIVDADLGAKLVDSIQGGLSAAGDLMGKGKELIDGIIQGATDAWESGKEFFTGLGQSAVDAVGDLASTLLDAGTALLKGLEDGAHTAWDTAAGWLGQRGSDAVSAVGNLGSTLLDAGTALLTGLKNGAETVWSTVDGWLGGRGSAAVSAIGDLGGTLVAAGTALLTGLKNGAESGWSAVEGFLGGIAGKAVSAVGNLGSALVGAGASLIGGLVSGIQSAIPSLDGILSSITSRIPNLKGPPVKDATLLYPSGQLIMQGLGEGLADGFEQHVAPVLQSSTAAIAKGVSGDMGGAIGSTWNPDSRKFSKPDAFAAFFGGTFSEETFAAFNEGMKFIADGMAEENAAIEQARRAMKQRNLSAEKQRFAAWMRQQGRGYEIDTLGVEGAWRAYYGQQTGPGELDDGGWGPAGPMQVTIQVDGRALASVVTPYISGQMSANVKGMVGGGA